MNSDIQDIINQLIAADVIDAGAWRMIPLSGGVSSDICMLQSGERKIVVKQSLAALRVKDEWRVDTGRNVTEQRYIKHVTSFLPAAMPRLLYCNEERNYFVMEYLEGFEDWKSRLMAGQIDSKLANQAGCILGVIHSRTWKDPSIMAWFDTTRNFHALRTEPYLITSAHRHPHLGQQIRGEAARLEQTRQCLIHGDYSPKNIMISQDNMIVLDCEVGWYGEPAFDLAFLCAHFLLKALHDPTRRADYVGLVATVRDGYRSNLHTFDEDLEHRTGRLLLILMLARIDGKSPVEYIDADSTKQLVRDFVYLLLPAEVFTLDSICEQWLRHLNNRHYPD